MSGKIDPKSSKIVATRFADAYRMHPIRFNCPNKQSDSDPITTWLPP